MSSLLFALLNAIRALIPCPLASLPPRASELVSFFAVLPFRVYALVTCACAHARRSPAARIITLGQEKPSGEFAVHRLNKQAPRFGFSRRLFFSRLPHVRILSFFLCRFDAFPRTRIFHSLCFLVHSATTSLLCLFVPLVHYFLFSFFLGRIR